jgi:hypothetical protein
MKQSIRLVLFCTVLSLFVFSCGDNSTPSDTTTDSTSATDTMAKATTSSQPDVVTTPENIVIVRYKVSDFAKWRALYDSRDSMRTANGLHTYVLGRGVKDSSTIMVALKADDMAKAKAFSKDASLKSALQKGFVKGSPTYNFTTVVYQDMSANMSDLRSMNFFKVKDWDTWKNSFEAGKQIRTDNGLTARAYGYDMDDNHKVVLVVGINDSTKAEAYWNSDLIKERRKLGGVEGNVERFVYRLIQKY